MSEAQTQQMKPNVVFILVDNLGWGDLGCFGGANNTPNIDALAAGGMRLKNYNIEAQCTPTRSAILRGRMPIRTGCSSVHLPGQHSECKWRANRQPSGTLIRSELKCPLDVYAYS